MILIHIGTILSFEVKTIMEVKKVIEKLIRNVVLALYTYTSNFGTSLHVSLVNKGEKKERKWRVVISLP